MSMPRLTLLNSMASHDFEAALDCHARWGIDCLDLKDCIFGKYIADLSDAEAIRANEQIARRRLSVYCLSSSIFASDIEVGRETFLKLHLPAFERVLAVAKTFKPRFIRLLGAQTSRRAEIQNSASYIREAQPWLLAAYRDAVDRIFDAGFMTVIENEVEQQIFASPAEIVGFFSELNRPKKAAFTWDIANLWQCGVFPTVDIYRELKEIIGYIHLKGGKSDELSTSLSFASTLQQAAWPVREILAEVVSDGVSPVICLNPPHGRFKDVDDSANVTERDLEFTRSLLASLTN
jgi:hypothetical protein